MNELTTMTDETLLAMGIAHYDQCENAQQQAVINAAKSGMYFLEAKAKMHHGEFMPKIAQLRADISHSKINKYMQLSKEMPELLNSDARPNLNYAQAIALMSAPEELKAEIVERIDNGEEISSREIQRLKAENKEILDNLAGANNEISEKQKRLDWLEMDKKAIHEQNDQLRNRDQSLIDAKVAEEKAKLMLENQQAIAEAKRQADNLAGEIERLKREQEKAIEYGVKIELGKLETEMNQKRYQIEVNARELEELKKVRRELDAEVGALAIHKDAIKNIKIELASLTMQFSDAFDTGTIPNEVTGDWGAIYDALSKLLTQMSEWRGNSALIGELVD